MYLTNDTDGCLIRYVGRYIEFFLLLVILENDLSRPSFKAISVGSSAESFTWTNDQGMYLVSPSLFVVLIFHVHYMEQPRINFLDKL